MSKIPFAFCMMLLDCVMTSPSSSDELDLVSVVNAAEAAIARKNSEYTQAQAAIAAELIANQKEAQDLFKRIVIPAFQLAEVQLVSKGLDAKALPADTMPQDPELGRIVLTFRPQGKEGFSEIAVSPTADSIGWTLSPDATIPGVDHLQFRRYHSEGAGRGNHDDRVRSYVSELLTNFVKKAYEG